MKDERDFEQFHGEVFPAELEEIRRRREAAGLDTSGLDAGAPDPRRGIVGMCFSGGGVRSSTFCFGVIQALARHNLLSRVDYLSTVSGGGFIGSCLSAVLSRAGSRSGGDDFPLAFRVGQTEPLTTSHLRSSGKYLAPGGGLDEVRIPTVILRGALINLISLLPYLVIAAGITEAIYWGWTEMETIARGSADAPPAWLTYRNLPVVGLSAFLALTFFSPLVIRVFGPSFGWAGRNFYERATAAALAVTVLTLVLIPFIGMVGWAINHPPPEGDLLSAFIQSMGDGVVDLVDGFDGSWTVIAILAGLTLMALARAIASSNAWIAKLAAYIFGLAGPALLWTIYLGLCVLLINPSEGYAFDGFVWILGAFALMVLFNGLFANVNTSSIHGFYRDRLSRAFLFSRRSLHELESRDSLKLSELSGEDTVAPYHLVNVTLNLEGSRDPSLRGRGADFFILSKRFCGSDRTTYQPTRKMEALDPHLDLAAAAAISGAAASPNAGTMTSKPLRFILTMMNIRLAYWLVNPATVDNPSWWQRMVHRIGPRPYYLFREALGLVDNSHAHVNISDGGHLENLGLYELLRRRCSLIVAVDAEADPHLRFPGLVKLIRYARIDLGVRIELDLSPLDRGEDGHSSKHFVIGKIDYGEGNHGVLVYLKSSLTGDENPYIRDYAASHTAFPSESTADQFFDEEQFEAYRALGYHVADGLLHDEDARAEIHRCLEDAGGPASLNAI